MSDPAAPTGEPGRNGASAHAEPPAPVVGPPPEAAASAPSAAGATVAASVSAATGASPATGAPPAASASSVPGTAGTSPSPAGAPGTGPAPLDPIEAALLPEGPGRVTKAVAAARARGRHPEIAAVLAFLLPGLGHMYLGRWAKGLVACFALVLLFERGIQVSHGECVSIDKENGHPVAFFAQVGAGIPTGIALLNTHAYEVKKALGMNPDPPFDPPRPEDPIFIERLPGLDEGLLFTMIAGLLNLLLIHDALLGAPGGWQKKDEEAVHAAAPPVPPVAAGGAA